MLLSTLMLWNFAVVASCGAVQVNDIRELRILRRKVPIDVHTIRSALCQYSRAGTTQLSRYAMYLNWTYVLNHLLEQPSAFWGKWAELLDELSIGRDMRRVYGPAHLRKGSWSRWGMACWLAKQIRAMNVGISSTVSVPRHLKLSTGDSLGSPTQILKFHRADWPHYHLLDFLLSIWARPICSKICQVKGPVQSTRRAV